MLVDGKDRIVGQWVGLHSDFMAFCRLDPRIGSTYHRIKYADAGTLSRTARDLGCIDQRRLQGIADNDLPILKISFHIAVMERSPADTPGIEEVHFIKQLGAFNKELTVFIKTDFKRRQVKDLVVRLDLAEIRYEGHIQRECFGNTHFYIHATADVFTPR